LPVLDRYLVGHLSGKGVFACYRPLPPDAPMPAEQKELSEANWRELYHLSHADTRRAYEAYTSYYLSTSGQRYWSDLSQLSLYIDGYHAELDRALGRAHKGSEMITELYVPRPALPTFLAAVRADFRQHRTELIYGTIRLIERDSRSFLAWAREPWACTVMNLHVDHTEAGIGKAAADFRRLIDRAIECGGSYFLTYHLSSLGKPHAGRGLLSADARIPAAEAPLRSRRGVPERVVPPPQADVRGSALISASASNLGAHCQNIMRAGQFAISAPRPEDAFVQVLHTETAVAAGMALAI
jgi:hypothetical protein